MIKNSNVLLRVYSGTMTPELDKKQTDWLRANIFKIVYGEQKTNIRLNCLAGYSTPSVLKYLTDFDAMMEVDVTSKALIELLNEYKGENLEILNDGYKLSFKVPKKTPILASTHTSERDYMNLPSGETCTGPEVVGGKPTGVDGTISLNTGCMYSLSQPIDGKILFSVNDAMIDWAWGENMTANDEKLLERIKDELFEKVDNKTDPAANAFGELGLNTNHLADKIPLLERIYNKIMLEKESRGIHWAYGGNDHFSGYKKLGVALHSIKEIHVDNSIPNATIVLPDKRLLYNKGELNRTLLASYMDTVREEMSLRR